MIFYVHDDEIDEQARLFIYFLYDLNLFGKFLFGKFLIWSFFFAVSLNLSSDAVGGRSTFSYTTRGLFHLHPTYFILVWFPNHYALILRFGTKTDFTVIRVSTA